MQKKFRANKSGGIYGNTTLMTPAGRLGIVNLLKPSVNKNYPTAAPKYSADLLFDTSNPAVKEGLLPVQAQALEMLEEFCQTGFDKNRPNMTFEKYKEGVVAGMTKQPIFRDGNLKAKYDGYSDTVYMSAKNPDISQVVIVGGDPLSEFVSGRLVMAEVQLYLGEGGFAYTLQALKLLADDGVRYTYSFVAPEHGSLLAGLDSAVAAVKANNAPVEQPAPTSTASPLSIL